MGRLARSLFSSTFRSRESDEETLLLGGAGRSTLDYEGTDVAVYEWGEGERSVLLMHGWNGHTGSLRSFVQPLLDSGVRVLAFDAPGHGRSGGKRTNLLEIADIARGLAADAGGIDAVVGHSFGGMCAVYAAGTGLAAGKLVCIGSPAEMNFLLDSFAASMHLPDAVKSRLRGIIEDHFGDDVWRRLSADVVARELACEGLVVHDRADPVVPWAQGKLLADAWPGARMVTTEGLGHTRLLHDDGVIGMIVEFVA